MRLVRHIAAKNFYNKLRQFIGYSRLKLATQSVHSSGIKSFLWIITCAQMRPSPGATPQQVAITQLNLSSTKIKQVDVQNQTQSMQVIKMCNDELTIFLVDQVESVCMMPIKQLPRIYILSSTLKILLCQTMRKLFDQLHF